MTDDPSTAEHTTVNSPLPEGISAPAQIPREWDQCSQLAEGLRTTSFGRSKLVVKPWGWERWLHETTSPFGFKVIQIKAGHRTSLQYHRHKRETYFILLGAGRLHYRRLLDGEDVVAEFSAGSVGHVDPGTVHRVEALTDLILIEATTPDDGSDNVRIQDDLGRPSGIIRNEHQDVGLA